MIGILIIAVVFGTALALYNSYKTVRKFFILRSNPITFEGKTVWISGASTGIGAALAVKLSHLGANLILTARSEKSFEEVKSKCNPKSKIMICSMDMSDFTSCRRKVREFLESLNGQPIHIFVHNAGVSQRSSYLDFSYENHQYMMNLNYNTPYAITQEIAKYQIANNPKGVRNGSQQVIISSISARLGPGMRSSYCASKAALSACFDSIRTELAEDGLKVTQIYPGYVKSNGSVNALASKAGERFTGKDEEGKKSMELDQFIEECVKSIYLEESETYIVKDKTHILGVFLKELMPEVYFWLAARHFKKSSKAKND